MAGKFEIYTDKSREFRFRLKAENGEIILASEGYFTKTACANGILSVKTNATNDARYEPKLTDTGKFTFNLSASNGQVIGTSEIYETAAARDKGMESVKKNAPNAHTVVLA